MIRALALVMTLTALAVLVEWAVPHDAHVPRGTSALLGLVGCVVIVVVAKLSGKLWLERPEPPDE